MKKENKTLRTFGDTVGARAFPEAEDTELKSILGIPVVVKDFVERTFQYGNVAIILFSYPDQEDEKEYSCVCGGSIVRNKLIEAKKRRLFPLLGTISMGEGVDYYDIR